MGHLSRAAACAALVLGAGCASVPADASARRGYAVVVSTATHADPAWQAVGELLVRRHGAALHLYATNVLEALPALQAAHPAFLAVVATPAEAGRQLVRDVHTLARRFDDDPYLDCRWGIVTGYAASNALALAQEQAPLTVRRVASGTPFPLDLCEEGVWYSELTQGASMRKQAGGKPESVPAPADTTAALVEALGGCDLFITSGHATERDWQIGYRYRNGSFRCRNGQLFGLDTAGAQHPVRAKGARVYLPVGNCLMGHVDGSDAMALAFLNSAGVRQMAGYTVPTWFGYAGWGLLDYYLNQPGRYSLAESFVANYHALDHRLLTAQGVERRGLEHDRDVVAFFGDPAWDARLAPGPLRWRQSLERDGDRWTFRIEPQAGADSFQPVDRNGSTRGGRPLIAFLPERVGPARVLEGAGLNPVVTDDFVLVPLPEGAVQASYRVVFEAAPLK